MIAEITAVVRDLVTAAAAAIGAYVALRGLDTWRTKLRGDLARRLLRATYRVQDEIAQVRNPFMSSGEIAEASEAAGLDQESGPPLHPMTDRAVYQKRWEGLAEALSDLRVEEREAQVLWGRDLSEVFRPLRECVAELNVAIKRHLRDREGSEGPIQKGQLNPEDREEVDSIIYQVSRDPEQDPFTARIDQAVEQVENRVRPHLKSRPNLLARIGMKLGLP